MSLSVEQLATAGAAAAIGLGLIVLLWTLLRGRGAPAGTRIDPEQARLLADMKELTERLAGELEAKSAKLEGLLAEAERRTRELERAVRVEPPAVVVTAAARGASRVESRPEARLEPMHARVHELADQGLTSVQIAESTGVPTGQVELILALRRAGAR